MYWKLIILCVFCTAWTLTEFEGFSMCRVHMQFFFFFETLKCARINDTSRVIRNPNILHMRKQRRRCCNRAADQRLCFCYIDSVFPLLPKSEISASSDLLWLYSPVCVGPGWIPPNTGFGRKFVTSWHVFFVQ